MPSRITLKDKTIAYTTRSSARAKKVKIQLDAQHGLQVVIPQKYKLSAAEIRTLLENNTAWILKHYERIGVAYEQAQQRRYVTGDTIYFFGEQRPLEVITEPNRKRSFAKFHQERFKIWLRGDTPEDNHTTEARRTLKQWFRKTAKSYLDQQVALLANQMGLTYNNITVRDINRRWGSCSSKGNLNFNLRLMMALPDAIDYIIIHELCHLIVNNHSKAFWEQVAHYCPDYKRWIQWLREHSIYLDF